jgi:hypothetical protein
VADGNVYSISEVVGVSSDSVEQAVRNALKRADETLRNLDWFQVSEIRGTIDGADVREFQVALKIGFKLES